MYVACVTALIPGARTILYEGSPFFPNPTSFIKLISSQKVTALGTSPRWMLEMSRLGISPKNVADLSNLKTVSSTGMVLPEQLFEWFYDVGFPGHVRLRNMSGGTDIVCLLSQGTKRMLLTSLSLGWLFRLGKPDYAALHWRMSR